MGTIQCTLAWLVQPNQNREICGVAVIRALFDLRSGTLTGNRKAPTKAGGNLSSAENPGCEYFGRSVLIAQGKKASHAMIFPTMIPLITLSVRPLIKKSDPHHECKAILAKVEVVVLDKYHVEGRDEAIHDS